MVLTMSECGNNFLRKFPDGKICGHKLCILYCKSDELTKWVDILEWKREAEEERRQKEEAMHREECERHQKEEAMHREEHERRQKDDERRQKEEAMHREEDERRQKEEARAASNPKRSSATLWTKFSTYSPGMIISIYFFTKHIAYAFCSKK